MEMTGKRLRDIVFLKLLMTPMENWVTADTTILVEVKLPNEIIKFLQWFSKKMDTSQAQVESIIINDLILAGLKSIATDILKRKDSIPEEDMLMALRMGEISDS